MSYKFSTQNATVQIVMIAVNNQDSIGVIVSRWIFVGMAIAF
jgi:hypothetical protein